MNDTTYRYEAAGEASVPAVRTGVKVWDLPTRVFHWALATTVSAAVVTAQLGGNWIDWHLRLGIATLALLAFRLVWGVVGPRYARFSAFLFSPRTVFAYLRQGLAKRHAGHTPSGAIAVFAMLSVLLTQAISGLFSSDSISTEGPLAHLVGEASIEWATWVHLKLQWVIYGLIGLHVLAIAAYLLIKKENLVKPMFDGFKPDVRAPHAADSWATRLVGLLLLAACGAAAFWWLG
jgi:cytochrome b